MSLPITPPFPQIPSRLLFFGLAFRNILVNGKVIGKRNRDTMFKYLPDGGAIKKTSRCIMYYDKNHELHRDDGPAVINASEGFSMWYKHGKKHRDVDPALVYIDGESYWYENDNEIAYQFPGCDKIIENNWG